jgi:hypothetical protein
LPHGKADVKFTIEITRRVGEGVEILHRSTVDVIGPKWARSGRCSRSPTR